MKIGKGNVTLITVDGVSRMMIDVLRMTFDSLTPSRETHAITLFEPPTLADKSLLLNLHFWLLIGNYKTNG
jgi:hypothetical protein